MKSLAIAASLACAVIGAATNASAAVQTWPLQDVTFVDGGTATGWFLYDSATRTASDWDITTTAGPAVSAFHYLPANGSASTEIFQTNTVLFRRNGGGYLYLHFVGPLTAAGGSVDLLTVTSPQGSIELAPVSRSRAVRSGSAVVVVPEPGTWALMILGFGAAGSALRRRGRDIVATA